jgi:voltage-gated potassium channel
MVAFLLRTLGGTLQPNELSGRSRSSPTEPLQVKPETSITRRIVANPYFDLGVLAMILVSVLLLIVEIAIPNSSPYFDFVVYSGDVITCLFVIELIIRFVASKRKRRFFSEYFIDILAVLPLFRAFRFLRFLRLLRMLRLFRAVSVVSRNTRVLQWLFKQRLTEYLLTVVLLLFATLFGTLGLSHFRRAHNTGWDVLAQSFWETIFSLVAGEYVNSFPDSLGGKIVILLVQFCGLTFFALLTGTVSAVMIEKLKEGTVLNRLMLEDLENHIIICGYNAGVETIVSEFQNHPQFKEREIVIVTERDETTNIDVPFPTRVRTIKDDFTRVDVMRRCNIDACAVAVIVSDISGGRSRQDADARTVLAALTIEKLNPDVHTCAELSNAHSESHLRMGGVNEVIVTRSISGHLLAQAALYSSNVHLLQELLKPTQGHTFIPVPEDSEYVGKNFSEVLAIHHQKSGNIPIAVEKPNGELVINPKNYCLAEGDRLICIAQHEG